MKIALTIVAVLVAWFLYLARPEPAYYEIEPVSGFLIDKETNEPIEGAAVLVTWSAQEGFFIRPQTSGWWGWQYTSTDDNGYFLVKGWPYSKRPWFSSREITDYQPAIDIFKSGYKPIITRVRVLKGKSVPGAAQKRDRKAEKEIIEGLADKIVLAERLPQEANARYETFFKRFGYRYFFDECDSQKPANKGFITAIFTELKIALRDGVNVNISPANKEKILRDQHSYSEMCSLVKLMI